MTPGQWEWIDGVRLIPVDRTAEESLAGAAIVDGAVARLVHKRLSVDLFHDPRCWQVIEAAAAVDLDVNDDGIDWSAPDADVALLAHQCARRGTAIAGATDIQIAWLRQLVIYRSAEKPHLLMARVVEVADARRCNRQLVDRLDGLGVDTRWLTEADAIATDMRHRITELAATFGAWLAGKATDADMTEGLFRMGRLFGMDDAVIGETIAAAGTEDPWDMPMT